MSGPNGHANENTASTSLSSLAGSAVPGMPQLPAERFTELVAVLEVPFHPSLIEWRVTNTTKNQQPVRGQVIPYADQLAYTDRLNGLVTPAGWTRRYTIHTSANFERSKDQKIVAKVLVTCELIVFGLGSHSQAFKRACACFGLGRYLYYFTGTWVELDDRKRPKTAPQLIGWATPEGWRQGFRPGREGNSTSSERMAADVGVSDSRQNSKAANAETGAPICQIERMEQVVGKRMYRGLLKTLARVWNPRDIRDPALQQEVLAHMRAAERGLCRAEAARDKAGLAARRDPPALETELA